MGPSGYPCRCPGAPRPRRPARASALQTRLPSRDLAVELEGDHLNLDLDLDVGAFLRSSSEFRGSFINGSGAARPLPTEHGWPRSSRTLGEEDGMEKGLLAPSPPPSLPSLSSWMLREAGVFQSRLGRVGNPL